MPGWLASPRPIIIIKAGVRRSLNDREGSGAASQATLKGHRCRADPTNGKVGFELATEGIKLDQLYVLCQLG